MTLGPVPRCLVCCNWFWVVILFLWLCGVDLLFFVGFDCLFALFECDCCWLLDLFGFEFLFTFYWLVRFILLFWELIVFVFWLHLYFECLFWLVGLTLSLVVRWFGFCLLFVVFGFSWVLNCFWVLVFLCLIWVLICCGF